MRYIGIPDNEEIPYGMVAPVFLGVATAGLFAALVADVTLGPDVTVLESVGAHTLELRDSWLNKDAYAVVQETQDGPALLSIDYTDSEEVANAITDNFRQQYMVMAP